MEKTNKIQYIDGLKVSYNFPYALALHWWQLLLYSIFPRNILKKDYLIL